MPVDSLSAPVVPAPLTMLGPAESRIEPVLRWVAFGAASAIVLSIAVSQILLGLGIVLLLFSRRRLVFPPLLLPLSLFIGWTITSDLLSGNPVAGLPQIRKFFVFSVMLLVCSTFRGVLDIGRLVMVWSAAAALSAIAAVWQFVARWREAIELHAQLYDYVLDGRIKGLAGHWMTFGGEEMIAFLMLLALLLFSGHISRVQKILCWLCATLLWIAIVMGYTRSIFLLGVPVGVLILVWNRARRLVLAIPVVAAVTFLAAPAHIRERVSSVLRPHGDVDSNLRRSIMRRTGLRMIQSHPWFGLGPERIQSQFLAYVPPDVPKPLPIGWYGHLHNIYIQYAAERGLPALAFLLWFIGRMIRDFWRASKHLPASPGRFVFCGVLAVIGGVLAEGLFEHNLGDSEVLTMFLIVASCGYVAIDHLGTNHSEAGLRRAGPGRDGCM
jgi:putative inorganic carbon (hco3(-)) transporter